MREDTKRGVVVNSIKWCFVNDVLFTLLSLLSQSHEHICCIILKIMLYLFILNMSNSTFVILYFSYTNL